MVRLVAAFTHVALVTIFLSSSVRGASRFLGICPPSRDTTFSTSMPSVSFCRLSEFVSGAMFPTGTDSTQGQVVIERGKNRRVVAKRTKYIIVSRISWCSVAQNPLHSPHPSHPRGTTYAPSHLLYTSSPPLQPLFSPLYNSRTHRTVISHSALSYSPPSKPQALAMTSLAPSHWLPLAAVPFTRRCMRIPRIFANQLPFDKRASV